MLDWAETLLDSAICDKTEHFRKKIISQRGKQIHDSEIISVIWHILMHTA